jgi:hypothetical protein
MPRGEVAPEEVVDEALSNALQRDLKKPQRIYPELRKLVRRSSSAMSRSTAASADSLSRSAAGDLTSARQARRGAW